MAKRRKTNAQVSAELRDFNHFDAAKRVDYLAASYEAAQDDLNSVLGLLEHAARGWESGNPTVTVEQVYACILTHKR